MAHHLPENDTVSIPEIPVKDQLTINPSNTALVVVDMQNDFVRPNGALQVEAAADTVDGIAGLLDTARSHGVHIAFTQDTHTEDDKEFELWPPHCIEGTEGWEIIDDLPREDGDLVVQKNRYDGFYETPLDHYLTRVWDVDNLIIVGTVANICVGQTAASAGLRWFHVITPADGISAQTEFDQASALRQISFLYNGHIVAHTDDIAFSK